MAMTPGSFKKSRQRLLLWLLILAAACGPKGEIAGTYQAEGKGGPGQAEIVLELKADGDGSWKSGGEEIPFSWYVRKGELRINTKGGGVLIGDLEKDTVHLTLPGHPRMTFRKASPLK